MTNETLSPADYCYPCCLFLPLTFPGLYWNFYQLSSVLPVMSIQSSYFPLLWLQPCRLSLPSDLICKDFNSITGAGSKQDKILGYCISNYQNGALPKTIPLGQTLSEKCWDKDTQPSQGAFWLWGGTSICWTWQGFSCPWPLHYSSLYLVSASIREPETVFD